MPVSVPIVLLAQASPTAAPPSGGLPPDLVLAFVLLDITIILVVARLVGTLFVKIGQPRVVGEIVAGILLGPTLLGPTLYTWTNPPSFLHCDQSLTAPGSPAQASITACFFPQQSKSVLGIIGQLALVFFMFIVGLELDFDRLRGKGKGIGVVSFGVVLVPLAFAFLIAPLLYDEKWVFGFGTDGQASQLSFTLLIGAMLAVTAFPVMARILQEKGLADSLMGSVGVAAAAVVTVLMFLLVALASGVAAGQGAGEQVKRLVGLVLFVAVLFGVARPLLARTMGRRVTEEGGVDVSVFAWSMIFAIGCAYVSDRIGINVIPGAFLAGAVLPARKIMHRDLTVRQSEITTAILLPIFLAYSGLQTDFTRLGTAFIVGIVIFLAAGIVSKWGGGLVSGRLGGLSWAESNVIGILMNCRGLLVLVVGLIGVNQKVISQQMQVAGVLMALVTTAMTGPLFDWAARRLPGDEQAVPPSDRTPIA
ncbi:MAG: cation:proton antiporter [Acidimicrobiales bacterium]